MRDWKPYEFTTEHAWDAVAALSPDAVSEVLVVGDIHGTEMHLRAAIDLAVDLGVGAIVQVGDFWLSDRHWSRHGPNEASFMRTAHDSPVPIVVIDGNHEAWPTLAMCLFTQAGRDAVASRRPLHLGGQIWWAWRGSVWQWAGLRCGALGGAVSPDRRDHAVRRWRWPEEATTQEDLDRLCANTDIEFDAGLDVLFTHDAPAQVRNLKGGITGIPWETQQATNDVRGLLARAVEHTQPRLVIHGHWHRSNREHISDRTEVVGLANDGLRNHTAWLTAQPQLNLSYMT